MWGSGDGCRTAALGAKQLVQLILLIEAQTSGSARVAFWGRLCHKSVLGHGRPDTCSHVCVLFRGLTKTTAFILAVGDLGKMLGLLLTSACC